MHRGYVHAWRKLFAPDHPLAPSKRDPASRRDAWLDLCQMAQHTTYQHAGHSLKRGEVFVSVRSLANRWSWSKSRISRYFKYLTSATESGTMLEEVRGTPTGTIYLIVNYDTYNPMLATKRDIVVEGTGDIEGDTSGTPAGQVRDKNKNEALKTPPPPAPYTEAFEEWWGDYPRKVGKGEAFKRWKARLRNGATADKLTAARDRYTKYLGAMDTEMRYVKQGDTFLAPRGGWTEEWEIPEGRVKLTPTDRLDRSQIW